MIAVLAVVSLVLVVVIVAVVAYHLVGIYLALKRGADHLDKLAGGLVAIRDNTGDLNAKVDTINGGLGALVEPLKGANANLAAIVAVAAGK